MKTNDVFDKNKRRTLKLLTGTAVGSITMGFAPVVATHASVDSINVGSELIDCVLISRADGACVHFLMHNKTNNAVVAHRFETQFIVFGGVAFNMAEAYIKPVTIPAQDRVMVRLDVKQGMPTMPIQGEVVDLNPNTRYLPRGTREAHVSARMLNGTGRVENIPVMT